jgi:hypothetical protein
MAAESLEKQFGRLLGELLGVRRGGTGAISWHKSFRSGCQWLWSFFANGAKSKMRPAAAPALLCYIFDGPESWVIAGHWFDSNLLRQMGQWLSGGAASAR